MWFFPPSSQASTDEPSVRLNTAFCASFIPSLLFASTSLWPWQEVHHCEGSVQKEKGRKAPRWGKLSGLNEMRVIGSDTWSERLSFFLLERRRVRTMRAPFFQGGAVFFPAAKRNESTQQKSSQQSSFSTDFLHLTATLITLSGGTCARSADASALLPSWSLFYWAQVHTTFPLSVLCSLSE